MKQTTLKQMIGVVLAGTCAAGSIAAAEKKAATGPEISIEPQVRYISVSGNEDRFRQDFGQKEGWSGGLANGTWHQALGKNGTLDIEGRGLFDEEDYRLRLEIAKPDVGFVRAGLTEFRKYYDDRGGYYAPFAVPSFDLHRTWFIRNTDFFVEVGLTLPKLPQLTLGYERQSRDGTKSLLEWGTVQEGTISRKIFPSYKEIDEVTDIFRAELAFDIKKVHVADQFRYEHFRDSTTRHDGSTNLAANTSQSVTVHEDYHHDAYFNTFRMDSHLSEKIYWSLGYLYTKLDGAAGLDLVTVPAVSGFDYNWQTQRVDVDTDSHVVNFSTLLGPVAHLNLYGGVQAEKTESHGLTSALLAAGADPATTNVIHMSNYKESLQGTVGLRYTRIPFTVLYAEGKWTQQEITLKEEEIQNDGEIWAPRKTDADIWRQDYSVGFNSAPLPRVTMAGRYRHSIYENDYDHKVDFIPGYPAFITGQDFITDEVTAKLTLRPCSRFSTSLKYQWVRTKIETETEPILVVTPGGSADAADHEASIYSVSATVLPMNRLYCTGLLSWQDTHTSTHTDAAMVTTYAGNVLSALVAAGYALDEKTDLRAECSFERARNSQNKVASVGLPFGTSYDRNGFSVSLTRKIRQNITASAAYGYYDLRDDSVEGHSGYVAHMASVNCTVRF